MSSSILVTGATGTVGAPLAEAVRPAGTPVRLASRGSRDPEGVSSDVADPVAWWAASTVATTVIYATARLGPAGRLTDDVRSVTGRAPTAVAELTTGERAAWAPSIPHGGDQQKGRIL